MLFCCLLCLASILTHALPIDEAIRNVKNVRMERGQESDEENDMNEEEREVERLVAIDVAMIRQATEAALEEGSGSRHASSATATASASSASDHENNGGIVIASNASNCNVSCDCLLQDTSKKSTSSAALVLTSIPEGRLTVFDSAGSDYYHTRTFKGLDADVPINQPTSIQPGHFGTARGYVQVEGSLGTMPEAVAVAVGLPAMEDISSHNNSHNSIETTSLNDKVDSLTVGESC